MTQMLAAARLRSLRMPAGSSLALTALLLFFLLLMSTAVQDPNRLRPAVALAVLVALVGIATCSPVASLLTLFVWLVALGMSRRLVSEFAPITRTDPLLLVSPVVLGLLAAAAVRRGALRNRTVLTNAVLALSLLTLLGAINPLQGSLVGGISGLLFVFVPMLAFWIGRAYCDDRMLRQVLTADRRPWCRRCGLRPRSGFERVPGMGSALDQRRVLCRPQRQRSHQAVCKLQLVSRVRHVPRSRDRRLACYGTPALHAAAHDRRTRPARSRTGLGVGPRGRDRARRNARSARRRAETPSDRPERRASACSC